MDRLIAVLDDQFARLHSDSVQLVTATSLDELFRRPMPANSYGYSCGEQLLRSAAIVEQTFGGITTNLWDDPFEWTLPETLSTREKIRDYLKEVEGTRKRGFALFKADDDLMKEIMSPSGETQLLPLLLDTLVRAAHYLGCAQATAEIGRSKEQKS